MPSNDSGLEEKDADAIYCILNGAPFKVRPDNEKFAILKNGRPLHNIQGFKPETGKNLDGVFTPSFFSIYKWLSGSSFYNKLFCWPCLLMRPETSSWCSIGNDGKRKFTSLAVKHTKCKSHLKAINEYDEILSNFGLQPEFVEEINFKCKEEEGSLSDNGETGGDSQTNSDRNHKRNSSTGTVSNSKDKQFSESSSGVENPRYCKEITFKAWQEISKNSFPISKSKYLEDIHIYKWKRKIAKQELRNARLLSRKLQIEIQALKAKEEYYTALKQFVVCGNESSSNVSNFKPNICEK